MCDRILCAPCMEFFWSCASCEECECIAGDPGTFELAYEMGNITVFRLELILEESE
jgi:hypothetical protein